MANYEKQVEQEAAYPIPISLYNCYRTVRHEKRYISGVAIYASLLMPHCPVTVVQRYRDGVCSLLFHLFFIICHPYIPLHLEEMIFYTCIPSTTVLGDNYTKCKIPLTWQITVSDSDIGKSNGSDKGSRGRTKIDFKHFVSSRIRF